MSDRMQKITDESEVSTTELATVLGVSARRVQQMARHDTNLPQGLLPAGRFRPAVC